REDPEPSGRAVGADPLGQRVIGEDIELARVPEEERLRDRDALGQREELRRLRCVERAKVGLPAHRPNAPFRRRRELLEPALALELDPQAGGDDPRELEQALRIAHDGAPSRAAHTSGGTRRETRSATNSSRSSAPMVSSAPPADWASS